MLSPPKNPALVSELTLRKPVGLIAGATCAAIALSAIAGIVASVIGSAPLWFFLGFEVVTLIACAFGFLLAIGRFSDGPGLGLLCVVGAVAVGSVLGDISTQLANPIGGPVLRNFGTGGLVQIPITTFMALRLAAAGIVGVCAAWTVLNRHRLESMKSLLTGVLLGAAMLAVVAIGWKARSVLATLGSFATTIGLFAVGVLALGLLAASVHYTIRAFEFGRLGRTREITPRV